MPFKHYLTNKLNIPKRRVTDILQTTSLSNIKRLSHNILYRVDPLPSKVDLRPDMSLVDDQSRIGSR